MRYWLLGWLLFALGAAAALLAGTKRTERLRHRVEQGDTLYSIAKAHYGDGRMFQMLAQTNKITPPYCVHQGDTILLPEKGAGASRFGWLAAVCIMAVVLLPLEAAGLYAAGKAFGGLTFEKSVEAASLVTLLATGAGMWLLSPWIPQWWGWLAGAFVVVTILRVKALAAVCRMEEKRAVALYAASRPVVFTGAAFVMLAAAATCGERLVPIAKSAGLGFLLR